MSDNSWRRKSWYAPRVLIGTQDVLASPFPDVLLCLTGGQLNILRNLMQYAHRRSTFVSETHVEYYLAPTNEEWDDLQEIVDDLEDKLMSCEEYTQMMLDILEAAQCACESARARAYLGEIPPPPPLQESPFYYGEGIPDGPMTPAEEEACAVAQCWYQKGYEVITEHVLPASRVGFDILLPAVCGFVALITGGPVAALGYYTVAELIQSLMQGFYNAAETNLVNWLESNKDEIVCALYWPLLQGTTASAAWEAAWNDVVLPAQDISQMDKWIVDLFMGPWAGLNAQAAWNNQTAWALASVTPGYCDPCDEPPIQGDGWKAYHVNLPLANWVMEGRPVGCLDVYVPDGETCAGFVITHTELTGGLTYWPRRTNEPDACEGGYPWTLKAWGDLSSFNQWILVQSTLVDGADVRATINPAADLKIDNGASVVGPGNASCAIQWWNVADQPKSTVTVDYIITVETA